MAHSRYSEAWRATAALAVYWLRVFPQARRELRCWERRARAIPDPSLQQLALDKLRDEGVCAEGVAAFAILATTQRSAVVRFCVAFEVLYDLLDGLGEQPVNDVLANNRQLGHAFVAALDPALPLVDFLAFHPWHDDGGYVYELIAACRDVFATLPSSLLVSAAARRTAERAGEAQALNHSDAGDGVMTSLARWAAAESPLSGLRWWEVAAASAAPLGIYAMCALASRADVTQRDVAALDAAYFPWISGLLGLLESMVDREEDALNGTHSYAGHYASAEDAADRAGLFARESTRHVRSLKYTAAHRVILAGMVATNLSHAGARDAGARKTAMEVRSEVAGPVRSLLALLQIRRAAKRLTRTRLATAG